MCIRDRGKRVRIKDLFHLGGDVASLVQGVGERGCELGQDAVSYTHLRAHETVLDLVCRLLLEKKKKQEMITK